MLGEQFWPLQRPRAYGTKIAAGIPALDSPSDGKHCEWLSRTSPKSCIYSHLPFVRLKPIDEFL